jgi:hypothetical protein
MKKLIFSLLVLLPFKAYSWGDIGHSAIGAIAEQHLTERGRNWLMGLMGVEPLAISAVYPDQVRSDDRFVKFNNYHFVEIPDGSDFANMPNEWRVEQSAHTILDQAPVHLGRNNMSKEQKEVLMRYLVHIVGDVHQPFHVGNGYDRGANLCDVKYVDLEGVTRTSNLHAVWDDVLVKLMVREYKVSRNIPESQNIWFGFKEFAQLAFEQFGPQGTKENKVTPKEFQDITVTNWYKELQGMRPLVYIDGNAAPENRNYCKLVDRSTGAVINGSYNASFIPLLTEEYVKRSQELIKRQIVLAGLRLAEMINTVAQKARPHRPKKQVQEVLDSILLKDISKTRLPNNAKDHKLHMQHTGNCQH